VHLSRTTSFYALRKRPFAAFALTAAAVCGLQARPVMAQGTWSQAANAPNYLETPILMTDGTVIFHCWSSPLTSWVKLTPDSHGSYVNGTWSVIASNVTGKLYGQTALLRDGRVFYGGGEYLDSGATDHNTCEVYDPVANTWTAGPDSLYDSLGDTGSSILPDGRVLCSNWSNRNTDIFDPATNTWSNAAPMSNDTGDEETWVTMSDGSILSTFRIGQRYLPTQNLWVPTGAIPVSLVDSASEMGPVMELYDGRSLALGATGHTAFFTPAATLSGPGSWATGPDMPGGLSAPDTPGAVEVNGKVLCVGTPADFGAGTLLEYDPVANTFTTLTPPSGSSAGTSFVLRLLDLPTGQILMTDSSSVAWIYTPSGGPQPGWGPQVKSVTPAHGGVFTISGVQLNGLTNGSGYGDEANNYTHYPLVTLTDGSGNVTFAKTFGFSQMAPSAPGATQSASFSVPAGLANGSYTLRSNASGISSAPFSFTLGQAPAGLTAKAGDTAVTLSWAASPGADSYNLYRATTAGAETLYKSGLTGTGYTDTGLTDGQAYFYKLSAVSGARESSLSQEATATPVVAGPTATIKSIALSPATVYGGVSATGTVTLAAAATAATTVTLASSDPSVTLPSSVTVAAGATSATFTARTTPVAATVTATITAASGTSSKTATLKVAHPDLTDITATPDTVVGGNSAAIIVTLSSAAPTGGTAVGLTYPQNGSTLVSPPSKVVVPAGATTASIALATKAVTSQSVVFVTAHLGSIDNSVDLTVNPSVAFSFSLDEAKVYGGTNVHGVITPTYPAGNNTVITLTSSDPRVTLPSSITVRGDNMQTLKFVIGTTPTPSDIPFTITAASGSTVVKVNSAVLHPDLTSTALNPSSVTGGKTVTLTVTLSSLAPTGGTAVGLTYPTNGSVLVSPPSKVVVPAGATTASITLTTATVTATSTVSILAHLGAVNQTVGFLVYPVIAQN
jgi:hypothetical protein